MSNPSRQLVLAIETSCDETAVALCDEEGEILDSRVASQVELHAPYGGVVPELASRNHSADLKPLLRAVLTGAGVSWDEIAAVAATSGPGLASSLLIGDTTAKAIAATLDCPFYSMNHMEGHLLSPFIGEGVDIPSHLALVVSGGHTILVEVNGVGEYQVLGSTKDDAAGEAFDKVGKMLGLPYPGGPEISRRAMHGDRDRYEFPRSMIDSGDHAFSFSGLKTSVRYLIDKLESPMKEAVMNDVCASFEAAVVDVLVSKLKSAALESGANLIGVSGGVSCNESLRTCCETLAEENGWSLRLAAPGYATDNAAMIAFAAAARRFTGDEGTSLNSDINPNLQLGATS